VGLFPKWIKEFSFKDFFGGVKEDVAEAPKKVGEGIKNIVEPILSGARKALTPTVIWLAVIAVIVLILYTYFRKAVKA